MAVAVHNMAAKVRDLSPQKEPVAFLAGSAVRARRGYKGSGAKCHSTASPRAKKLALGPSSESTLGEIYELINAVKESRK